MALGIFEQLDWLTKKVKALCCIVENGGGGGSCGDCPVSTDGVTITGNGTVADPLVAVAQCGDCPITIGEGSGLGGDGTIANPLFVTNPMPPFEQGTFDPTIENFTNCTVTAPNGTLYFSRIGTSFSVWGQLVITPTGANWSFTIAVPPTITFLNPYTDAYQAVGYALYKKTATVKADVGQTRVVVSDATGNTTDVGTYNFSYTSTIL